STDPKTKAFPARMTTLAPYPLNGEECSFASQDRDRYRREDTFRAGDALLLKRRRNPRAVVFVKSVAKETPCVLITLIDEMDNRSRGLKFAAPRRPLESLHQK